MLFKRIITFIKKYFFVVFALLPFVFSDLQLRFLLMQKMVEGSFLYVISFGFTVLISLAILFLCWFFMPKTIGKIVYASVSSVFIVLSLSQYLYFKIFKKFFWLKTIILSKEATAYLDVALQNIDPWLLFCTGLSICAMIVTLVLWEKRKCNYKISIGLTVLPLLGIFMLHNYMMIDEHDARNKSWDSWNDPHVVYSRFNDANKCIDICGLSWATVRDFYNTVKPERYSENEYQKVKQFFEQKQPLNEHQY